MAEKKTKSKKDPRLARAGVSGFNKPKRTPSHPKKSHVVVAKEGDKVKTIRFGEQGAKTAGKPKAGEGDKMKKKLSIDVISDPVCPWCYVGKRRLESAIAQLPEDLRTAIMLREMEGMSYEDIAITMDCPIGTVRSRIFRAREAIDEKLKPLLDRE